MKKKLTSLILLLFAVCMFSQTTSENYIKTRVYLEPVGDSSSTAKQIQTVEYLDGLGRLKQLVKVKATPTSKDLVESTLYDIYGVNTRQYLPIPKSSTNNGNIYTQSSTLVAYPTSDETNFYQGEKVFSESIYEISPLNRIKQQKQEGNEWNLKPINFSYQSNNTIDMVKRYEVVATWNPSSKIFENSLPTSQSYSSNLLYKDVVLDEDGNETITFKNKLGQLILVRKVLNSTQNADTYYIYNVYNQLAYVIPPQAADALKNLSAGATVDSNVLTSLCYQYKYDGKNRLVEKKLPGKGWEYMVYDKADRLIMTQDAILRPDKRWLFTKYDKFSRPIYTGITADQNGRSIIQGYVDYNFPSNNEGSGSFTLNGLTVEYSHSNAFPNYIYQLLSVNYYDKYPTGSPAIPTQVLGQNVLSQDAQNSNISTKSLPTASYVKNIEDDNWTKNYTWYDTKGRPIGSHSINHLGGYTKTESELDFAGVTKQAITRHKRLATDIERVITENFTYDHQNRLKTHTHQIDNNPVEYLVQNTYNELSQLKTKKVGGKILGSGLQNVDYTYNIRGWMTGINDPNNLGSDLFGYKIKYNQVEGLQTPDASDPSLQVLPRYNGNIAEVDWRIGNENDPLKRYGYVYDGLNRLSAGFYQNSMNASIREYYEKVTYDLNGNIKTMKRTAHRMGTTALLIDNLSYQYENANISNRLQKINETVTTTLGYPYKATPTDIGYDVNGNMTSFVDKGISSIQYNFLNLPNQTIQNGRTTSNTYRADGVKLMKVFDYYGFDKTDYLDGFQYKNNWNETTMNLQFFPTSEGYYNEILGRYYYNYSDHLGNVRLSYSDTEGDGIVVGSTIKNCDNVPNGEPCMPGETIGDIDEVTNYYPFGIIHGNYYNSLSFYNYKYNGKELQETGQYDFGARFYMPDIGRWGVVDPLAEISRRFSPYVYGNNNPIRYIDPDGRQGLDWGRRGNQWEWNDKVTADNYKSMGYDAYSNGNDANSTYKTESGHWVSLSPFGNDWSYTSDPNKDSAPSDLEGYRAYRDYPLYHKGESWFDRFARNVNSTHMEILQDEGSGGGLMFGGYGRTIAAAEDVSMTSMIAAEAEANGILSTQRGINPAKVAEYSKQMSNGTYKPTGGAGYIYEEKYILTDGNHRMNAAIQHGIESGDFKYVEQIINKGNFIRRNPLIDNYKVYKLPVK